MDELLRGSMDNTAPLVIVIQGMAGVGKTALAVHWAHKIASRFPDGQLFVDLRGHTAEAAMDPQEALDRILRGLGVPGELVPTTLDAKILLARTHFASRSMLLILDNAVSSDQVHSLLASGRSCTTIVTSRNRLPGLIVKSSVHTVDLDVLQPEEAHELVSGLLGVGEASAHPEAIAELSKQCAYLPLALRIAAANRRVRTNTTVAEIARELGEGDRLSALAHDDDPYTSAVRTAFDCSYRELANEEKRAFCLLGLVTGPDFGPEVVAALLERGPVATRQILRGLTLANLVQDVGTERFRLHDLMSDYARERLRSEDLAQEQSEARWRLFDWLLGTAQNAAEILGPPRRPSASPLSLELDKALKWYERERHLLVATTRQAALGGFHKVTWQLADALFAFLDLRAYTQDNLEVHQYGAQAAELGRDHLPLATMLRHLACIYREQGRYEKAIRVGERARALSAAHKDQWSEAESMATLASIHWRCSNYEQVRRLTDGALQIRQRLGDRRGEAECLHDLARIHRRLGHCSDALRCDLEALDLRQELADRHGEARSFLNLSRVFCRMGMHVWGLQAADEALEIYTQLGAKPGQAVALCSSANILRHLNQPREAYLQAAEALEIQIQIGDSRGEVATRDNLARVHLALGEVGKALTHARIALSIDEQLMDPYGIALRRHTIGLIMMRRQSYDAAMGELEGELALREEIGDVRGTASTYIAMAELCDRMGLGPTAARHARDAVTIERGFDNPFALGRRLSQAARIVARNDCLEAARPYWEEARRLLMDFDARCLSPSSTACRATRCACQFVVPESHDVADL
ncbi:tetratricopeptide repeat protein [Actinomadura barringtoniae]|uniref:Tetratricopeptide repeat protein n=1 Tax=Actinomadura barringtoniae TaxID=1427535 RepID=A0A939PDZ5_9ACTN|nr:tetratricopeptide repeat protein [Actinomadura barringtoniae]MBO2450851.1 tetratricopeptide repeat protein [Actinomadura barringtoniae]